MTTKPNLLGILLAAGRGRRMGGKKQFHPVRTPAGEKPLVAAAFDTIANACDQMFVVLGHRAEEVATALGDRKFEIVTVDPDAPMFNSICAGLSAALSPSRRATPSGNPRTAWRSGYDESEKISQELCSILLQLGDHPAIEESTLEKLFAMADEHPDKAIMPMFEDKGGHPVLIPPTIAEKILATPCTDGLRGFWLDHADLCVRFEVNDPGVTCDIDTI